MSEEHTTPVAATPDLEALLAERGELCAQLSARQVEFAALVKDQAGKLAGLRDALAQAKESLSERHGEIAKLSRLVLELEDAVAAGAAELARASEAAREREDRQAAEFDKASTAAREREEGQAREIAALQSQLGTLRNDHALLRQRERERERDFALVEHELAVRKSDVDELRGALDRERDLASRLVATLARVRSSRAWKFGRAVFRQVDAEVPDGAPPPPDAREEDRRLLAGSDLFEPQWYLSTYPDVAASGMDPADHFLRAGAIAGYNPGPSFDTAAYLGRSRDVRVSGMNPLVHYLKYGQAESRDAGPETGEHAGTPALSCS